MLKGGTECSNKGLYEEEGVSKVLNGSRHILIDVLRGLAIFLVLGRHVLHIPYTLPPFLLQFFLVWRDIGWIGVDLFFVLSGFLVSGVLFKEYSETGRLRVGLFLIGRGMKIYPQILCFSVRLHLNS